MFTVTRRGFFKKTSVLGGLTAAGATLNQTAAMSPQIIAAEQSELPSSETIDAVKKFFPNGFPKCKLGKTGIETTILGMGTGMSSGRPYYDMGEEKFIKLMHHAFDQGVRYIDTAQNYRTHVYVQHALRGWKREDFFVLSKTPSHSEENARSDVNRYLYELETKYLDVLLLHCMTNGNWLTERAGAWKALVEEKKKGRIRAIGVSCHSLDAIKKCLEVEELDVALVRINPFGKAFLTDDEPEKVVAVVKELHEKGVGVLGMKIFGEGRCKEPEQRRQSLEFAVGLDCVDTMTIGFTEIPQVNETLGMLADIFTQREKT
ncbi:MAG: aldo/keto reductase [Planctomycetaceae bacterium]|jgi:aryl-alcohol dehydrogenase-like predicted oxidoreductase|nr:aldo/keto reductase [Planctomycetaceae bacterium]